MQPAVCPDYCQILFFYCEIPSMSLLSACQSIGLGPQRHWFNSAKALVLLYKSVVSPPKKCCFRPQNELLQNHSNYLFCVQNGSKRTLLIDVKVAKTDAENHLFCTFVPLVHQNFVPLCPLNPQERPTNGLSTTKNIA